MAWSRVNHPSDIVSENDEIRVMVLNVDRENERISLGLKQTLPDPWDDIEERYRVGEVVEGRSPGWLILAPSSSWRTELKA